MREIRALAQRLASHESATVLLLGESGCGKDLLARAIHYESPRAHKPFMNITCTALTESLLESELFGYEKGAFTGAAQRKQGLFEAADGGTVFLDEIGELTPGLQAKLLRVIEEKSFHRVGGTSDVTVNVRIIAATNKDLQSEMNAGRFRRDLFFRLATMPILLPPLRQRTPDILLLARHFLADMSREAHRNLDGFTSAAERALIGYAWPGNVRELRNVIERAVLLSDGPLVDELGLALGRFTLNQPQTSSSYTFVLPPGGCDLARVEEELVRQALDQCGGNQTQAAELLNITRDQVRYRLGKYSSTE